MLTVVGGYHPPLLGGVLIMFWLIVLAIAVVLFALAWWSSGRNKHIAPRPDAGAETDRGWATNQALIHRDGSQNGTMG
jgi:hypothetical protein